MFSVDFHIHTKYSFDSTTSPEEVVKNALKKGLNGVAIVDHNVIRGALEVIKIREPGLLVIPGVEIQMKECHLIALNVIEEPKKTSSLAEVVEEIHNLGGIAILAHPYDIIRGSRKVDDVIVSVDAIEVANASSLLYRYHSKKAFELSRKHNKGITAGSDSHIPETVGDTYISFPKDPMDIDALISMVLEGKGIVYGKRTSLKNTLLKLHRRWLGS